jgi:hypothetical protein
MLFCLNHNRTRESMLLVAETQNLRRLLNINKKVRVMTRWLMKTNILAQFSLATECLEWFRSAMWAKRMHTESTERSQYLAFKTITRRLDDERAERDFYSSEDFSFIHIVYSNFRMSRLKSMTQRVWNIIIIIIRNTSVRVDAFMTTIINTVTSKKLSDSLIFIDDKNFNIEDWLFVIKNKLKENADWFSIETSKKIYVRTRIDEDAMKHLTSRFKKDSIKSFLIAEEIFDDFNRVFDDFNKRINVLKTYKRLKQIEANKEFHIFFAKFQRLTSDSKIYDETILLKDLKNKMSWDLQKTLTSNIYKAIDLYKFARFCQFTDQTLRDVDSKIKNVNRDDYEESTSKNNASYQESSRDQSNTSRFESQILTSSRIISQTSIEEQVNAFSCYNCEKSEHITRRCSESKKLNLNSFVREIEEHVLDNDNQNESRKE